MENIIENYLFEGLVLDANIFAIVKDDQSEAYGSSHQHCVCCEESLNPGPRDKSWYASMCKKILLHLYLFLDGEGGREGGREAREWEGRRGTVREVPSSVIYGT